MPRRDSVSAAELLRWGKKAVKTAPIHHYSYQKFRLLYLPQIGMQFSCGVDDDLDGLIEIYAIESTDRIAVLTANGYQLDNAWSEVNWVEHKWDDDIVPILKAITPYGNNSFWITDL